MKKKILIIDDDKDILTLLSIKLKDENYEIIPIPSPLEAIDFLSQENVDLILVDQLMPELSGIELVEIVKDKFENIPIIVMTAYGEVEDAVKAIKAGAYYYITKPINYEELKALLNQALEISYLKKEVKNLKEILGTDIVAESSSLKNILKTAEKIAPFDTTVLITGESGTGKEVLAKFIHKKSKRAKKPFITVNCGAIPEELLESELFGYKKGAFTGANTDKKGLIEEADGGTLFLDEIGELPLNLQVKLLRVLQEGEIKPLGASKSKKVDVRFIAATNRNLEKLVKEGKFREDLFYRLNVIHIEIPPLRKRKEDIIPLAKFFIKKVSAKYNIPLKTLSKKAEKQLLEHSWPGNVRELENTIERIMLTKNSQTILSIFPSKKEKKTIRPFHEEKEDFEKEYIENLLEHTEGNISQASKISGLTRAQIYRLMKRYNIQNIQK